MKSRIAKLIAVLVLVASVAGAAFSVNETAHRYEMSGWWYYAGMDFASSSLVAEGQQFGVGDAVFPATRGDWYGIFVYDYTTARDSWSFGLPPKP